MEFHRKRRRGIDALRQEIIESKRKKTGLGVLQREDPKVIEEVGKLSGESSVEFAPPKQGLAPAIPY